MTDFSLWFAYYDSLFLNPDPKLSSQFYLDHMLNDINWPNTTCPSLSEAYIYFENFLIEADNWIISQCKIEQLYIMETELENLMRFLLLQKSYAYSFWDKDIRRVEASTVHLYTLIQLLVKAVIPYPTMTLFQTKTANKLCLKINNLQNMMNAILNCVNPIAKFLSHQKFQQQHKIVTNFFENWVYFMKKLPNIKRSKLNHVHNLVKYICLTNPIEICTVNKQIQYGQAIRKKSNTVGAQILQIQSYPFTVDKSKSAFIVEDMKNKQQSKVKVRKRSMSCSSITLAGDKFSEPQKDKQLKLFSFPVQLIKYAKQQQNRKKKSTISSLNSLKNIHKIPTQSTNQTLNPSIKTITSPNRNKQKIRSLSQKNNLKQMGHTLNKNVTYCDNSSSSPSKNINLTKFYQEEAQRNQQINSVRSQKESSIRKRELSLMSIFYKQKTQSKCSKKEIHLSQKSNFSLASGQFISKKWDKLKSNISQKICIQNIQKILNQK